MLHHIEYLGDGVLEISGVGSIKKGIKLLCSKQVAEEFKKDKRFKIHGLKEEKPKAKEVRNAG